MQLIEFYADMITASELGSDLRKRHAANIIRTITRNRWYYPLSGEQPKLDKLYNELVNYKIKRNMAKNRSQLITLIKEVEKLG